MKVIIRFLVHLRWLVAHKILRGRLMECWLWRLNRRFAIEYAQFLSQPIIQNQPPPTRQEVPLRKIRRMLFICENMWEERELLPELRKIAPTDFIDVTSWIKRGLRRQENSLDVEKLWRDHQVFFNQDYEVVFIYLCEALQSEEFLKLLRSRWSCLLVGMNLDDKGSYFTHSANRSASSIYAKWAKKFDLNLTNSLNFVDIYRSDGAVCQYLPTGYHYDPEKLKMPYSSIYDYPITFAGSQKIERFQLIRDLNKRGLTVKTFGHGWEKGEFLQQAWKLYPRSQLNLGIGYNMPGRAISNLKNRDFECPGAGGCYLTTYDWELAQLFEIGKEILCYRGVDDLIEVATYYGRRPDLCLEIARAGFEKCRNEHTWEKRFRTGLKGWI
jgi:hypothetical protein